METLTHPAPLYSVEAWREEVLLAAGYPQKIAYCLAQDPDIDLHHAAALLEHGCPVLTAMRILL